MTTAEVQRALTAFRHHPSQALLDDPALPPVWAPGPPTVVKPYRAVTAYRAPELFARGERAWLTKYYAWCRKLGATVLRVKGMWSRTGYSPQTFPKYYEQLRDFFAHAYQEEGLWVHHAALLEQEQQEGTLSVRMPLTIDRTRHIEETINLARGAGTVLLEIGDAPSAQLYLGRLAGLQQLPSGVAPSVTWEPMRIGAGSSPGQHAVQAAVCDEAGQGWCIHGGFSSMDPGDDSDLQNCIAPEHGTLAADCALAVGEIWTKR